MLKNQNPVLNIESSILVDFDLDSDYRPELIFYDLKNKKETRNTLEKNSELNMYIHPDHFCIGYHTIDEYHAYLPCPKQEKIEKGFQCESCKQRDLLIPCMLCKGDECHNIDSIKEVCDKTPTSVYLVTVGEDVKVGVSKKDRLMKRWLEQGAELAAEVALIPNGLLARAVEEAISWNFVLSKGIRINKKFDRVKKSSPDSIDEDKFYEIILKVSDWVEKQYGNEYKGLCEINDLNSYYDLPESVKLDTKKSNVSLKGKFVGMKGSIFVINQFNQNYYFDVRELRGRKIGMSPAQGSQGVLSDFF